MSEGDRDMETVLKPEQKSLKEQLLKAFKAYDVDAGGVRRASAIVGDAPDGTDGPGGPLC